MANLSEAFKKRLVRMAAVIGVLSSIILFYIVFPYGADAVEALGTWVGAVGSISAILIGIRSLRHQQDIARQDAGFRQQQLLEERRSQEADDRAEREQRIDELTRAISVNLQPKVRHELSTQYAYEPKSIDEPGLIVYMNLPASAMVASKLSLVSVECPSAQTTLLVPEDFKLHKNYSSFPTAEENFETALVTTQVQFDFASVELARDPKIHSSIRIYFTAYRLDWLYLHSTREVMLLQDGVVARQRIDKALGYKRGANSRQS